MKWIILIGIGAAMVIIASAGRIPGTGRQLAVSDETRTAAAVEHTPKYTRQRAIEIVAEHIRESCAASDEYIADLDSFEARWMRQPRTDDHHERGTREWTVSDPLSGAYWRMYEDNLEEVDVIGDC